MEKKYIFFETFWPFVIFTALVIFDMCVGLLVLLPNRKPDIGMFTIVFFIILSTIWIPFEIDKRLYRSKNTRK